MSRRTKHPWPSALARLDLRTKISRARATVEIQWAVWIGVAGPRSMEDNPVSVLLRDWVDGQS